MQIYSRRKDLQGKYDFPFIAWQYMRSEIGNYVRTENSQKRKPISGIISLDADYAEMENFYSAIGVNSVEDDVLEKELLNEIMENLSEIQQKITKLKIDGYNSKEIYITLKMPSSTYYKEMKRIRAVVENILNI